MPSNEPAARTTRLLFRLRVLSLVKVLLSGLVNAVALVWRDWHRGDGI